MVRPCSNPTSDMLGGGRQAATTEVGNLIGTASERPVNEMFAEEPCHTRAEVAVKRRPIEVEHAEPSEKFATAEPLTPEAFGDPHFGPRQVCAGALCAGCQ